MTPKDYSQLLLEVAHIWRKVTGQRHRAQEDAQRAFGLALSHLTPKDIAIDLGANVGEFTVRMAATGAQVFAFEPDPHAFVLLREKLKNYSNVTLIEAGAHTKDGKAKLYRSAKFNLDPDSRTQSSSLFGEKRNVSQIGTVEVATVDFPAFIADLNHDIALIKMDIEGGEVPLMEALLAAPVGDRIQDIFVETHERGLPHLAARTAALKSATAVRTAPNVNWDWH